MSSRSARKRARLKGNNAEKQAAGRDRACPQDMAAAREKRNLRDGGGRQTGFAGVKFYNILIILVVNRFHNPEVEGSIPSITTNHHQSPAHPPLGFFVAQKQQMSRKCYAFDLYQA